MYLVIIIGTIFCPTRRRKCIRFIAHEYCTPLYSRSKLRHCINQNSHHSMLPESSWTCAIPLNASKVTCHEINVKASLKAPDQNSKTVRGYLFSLLRWFLAILVSSIVLDWVTQVKRMQIARASDYGGSLESGWTISREVRFGSLLHSLHGVMHKPGWQEDETVLITVWLYKGWSSHGNH